jgi:hypothetical protein
MQETLLALSLAFSLAGTGTAQSSAKPRLIPLFSTIADGPAFFVECRNDAGATLSSGARQWASSLRLDGEVLKEEGGRIGPGLTVDVEPGQTWRGIVVLRQSNTGDFPEVKFGAMVRTTRMVRLNQGRHTLAIRCGEMWSDDVEFFWENERYLPGAQPE